MIELTQKELKEQHDKIKPKIQIGDYITASEMISKATGKKMQASTLRMRFIRLKPDAIKALQLIVDAREELIEEFKS